MNEAFKKYWKKRLEEDLSLDDADKIEAQMAFEAAYNLEIWECEPSFFKYRIGDNTNKGIIVQRHYLEFRDKNGADRNGIYYDFGNGNIFSERLVHLIEEIKIDFPLKSVVKEDFESIVSKLPGIINLSKEE